MCKRRCRPTRQIPQVPPEYCVCVCVRASACVWETHSDALLQPGKWLLFGAPMVSKRGSCERYFFSLFYLYLHSANSVPGEGERNNNFKIVICIGDLFSPSSTCVLRQTPISSFHMGEMKRMEREEGRTQTFKKKRGHSIL